MNLLAGEDRMNVDFCFEPATISGTKFIDQNGNCIFEPATDTRAGAGLTVELYRDDNAPLGTLDAGDTLVATDTTDANGAYLFTGLTAGRLLRPVR